MSSDEICRAAVLADVALSTMTIGWLYAVRRARTSSRSRVRPAPLALSRSVLVVAAVVTGIIGIIGLLKFGFAAAQPAAQLGEWKTSSYFFMTTSWALQAVLMLHFVLGFPKWLLFITPLVLFITMFNTARFTVVLGVLSLIFIYASRTGRRWPTLKLSILGVVLVLLFFPMKTISRAIRDGQGFETIMQEAIDVYTAGANDERHAEVDFLDMAACVMTLSDQYGERLWGRPWLLILAAPIPRQFWPDKPPLNEYLYLLQTNERPMFQMGMTPLIFGDAYLNFGIIGVMLWPLIVGYVMGRLYQKAILTSHLTGRRLMYLVLLACSLQLYRDCLVQALLFPLTDYLPLLVAGLVSAIYQRGGSRVPRLMNGRPVAGELFADGVVRLDAV
jgi:hypothetical protein